MQYGDFSEKNVQKRMQGPNWQQSLYTQQMAKIPHSSFKDTYEQRKEDERRIGPGAYPIADFLTEADRRPQCVRGALDQLSPRFPKQNLVGKFRFQSDSDHYFSLFLYRTPVHHRLLTEYPMKKLSKNVGNKAVQFHRLNGTKAQELYH